MSLGKKEGSKTVPKKSMLEDWESFRAWQDAFFKAHGKRIPIVT
jgi:hypothetical protein